MHNKFTYLINLVVIFAFGFNLHAQQALPELLYYRFDQPGTSIPNDATSPVGNNPATIIGTALSIGGVGLSGTALVGTGGASASNAINTNWNTNLSGSFTIGFWTSSVPASTILFYVFGDPGANSLRCFTNGAAGTGNWMMRGGGLPDISATGAATMTANYIHFVYDAAAGTLTSYINGVVSNTATVTSFTGMSGSGFQVGAYGSNTGYNGLLDEFRIYNRALTVAEIQATINGTIVTGPCTSANAGVATPASQTICVGNTTSISAVGASLGSGATYQWQSSPNGITWTNMPNDTITTIAVAPLDTTFYRMIMTCGAASSISSVAVVNTEGTILNGSYTINQFAATGGTNFASFSDFFNSTTCGVVTGPVTVNVVANTGPYIERVEAGVISGVSATNTITINGNGNTLTYSASGSNDRTTMVLDGTSYLHIDSLNIFATGFSHGWVLQLTNGADHNTFSNCHFETNTSSTSTLFSNVVMSGSLTFATTPGNSGSFNTFENNTHVGGYYGFAMNGPGTTNFNVGNKIINSTFEDFFLYGLYLRSQEDVEIVGNDISRATRTTVSTLYGLYFANGIRGAIVKNNRLHDFYNANTANSTASYPVYMTGATGTAAKPNILANNLVYNLEHSGIQYSLYLLGAANDFWKIYHNTVVIDQPNFGGSNATRSVFITGAQNNMEIKNNIFYMNRGSAPQFYVYLTSAAANVDIDNNVYYSPNASNVTFGFLGANLNTFGDWQTAGFDNNGTEFNPTFIGGTGSDFLRPSVGSIKSMGANVLSDVPVDIEGTPRGTSPDPGAYEFTPIPCTGVFNFSADSVFPNGTILSWESSGNVSEWQIEWDTCGFIPGLGFGNLDSVVTNNTSYNLAMPMGECFCVFVREKCPTSGYGVWTTAPLNICLPLEYDAELVSLVSPEYFDCGDSLMEVKVEIRNNGFFPITSLPITVDITGDINQTLTTTYTGNLQKTEVDTITMGVINAYWGGYINVVSSVSLPNDQFTGNDTLSIDSLVILPFQPRIIEDTFCAREGSATLRLMPFPNIIFNWFDAPVGGNVVHAGNELSISTSAAATYYVEYNNLQDSLESTATGNAFTTNGGVMFDLAIINTLSVSGFSLVGASSGLTDVEVYYKQGSLQGHESNPASWTLHETVTNVNLQGAANFVRFTMTNPIPMNAGQTYGIYLQPVTGSLSYTSGNPLGSSLGSNSDLNILAGVAKAGQWPSVLSPRSFKGRVHYGSESCSDIRTPITLILLPDSVVANFTWSTLSHTVNFANTSVNADSLVWDFAGLGSATGNNVSFQFPQTDSFEVCLMAYGSCGIDTICQMVWAENISVEKFKSQNRLMIYPNPSNGNFKFEMELSQAGNIKVEVLDLSGKLIHSRLFNNLPSGIFSQSIHTEWPSGVYVLRISSPDGVYQRRISIVR
ncbi:MAG: T9SS C-terminal target domain-containing protein [Flavobacteriales bacterium]|nr:MAG: T9SS C-terminal target domain-containing protein [Flavobacteriales bacterium]